MGWVTLGAKSPGIPIIPESSGVINTRITSYFLKPMENNSLTHPWKSPDWGVYSYPVGTNVPLKWCLYKKNNQGESPIHAGSEVPTGYAYTPQPERDQPPIRALFPVSLGVMGREQRECGRDIRGD
jgi:hypothetical protein